MKQMNFTEAWTYLSLFESSDLIQDFYFKKHGNKLKDKEAKEITSSFAQGREYFKSASNASDIVKPLLLYYGVSSLSRGLIYFLHDYKSDNNINLSSHGLKTNSWGSFLSRDIKKLPELKIKLTKDGTFRKLYELTNRKINSVVYTGPFPKQIRIERPHVKTLKPLEIFEISLKELVSRVPELIPLYPITFKESPNCFKSLVFFSSENTQTSFCVFETGLNDEEAKIRQILQFDNDVTSSYRLDSHFLGNIKHFNFLVKHSNLQDLIDKSPVILNSVDGNTYLMGKYNNDIEFSQIDILYMIAFSMGMLVRYHPSQWSSLIGRQDGDKIYPILKAAIEHLEFTFPQLIVNELTR